MKIVLKSLIVIFTTFVLVACNSDDNGSDGVSYEDK